MPDLSRVVSLKQRKKKEPDDSIRGYIWKNRRRLQSYASFSSALENAAVNALGGGQIAYDSVHAELQHRIRPPTVDQLIGHGKVRALSGRRSDRRLVFYTDDIPATIDSIYDGPVLLCPGGAESEASRCTIVSSTVCVVLEPGDDETQVRNVLVRGLGQAIDSGEFEANVPPELDR